MTTRIRTLLWTLALVAMMFSSSHMTPAHAYYVNEDNDYGYSSPTHAAAVTPPTEESVPSSSSTPVTADLYYEVQSGDTLSRIARSFDSKLNDRMEANPQLKPNVLHVGQKLCIPKSQVRLPDVQGGPAVVQKVLSSTLTAYTAGEESTGKTPSSPDYGITYSGSFAAEGRTIAVDPNVIPLGSVVYIEGIGVRKAEDTGSAIKGAKIDVFMEDVGQARDFGVKRNVRVYVLEAA